MVLGGLLVMLEPIPLAERLGEPDFIEATRRYRARRVYGGAGMVAGGAAVVLGGLFIAETDASLISAATMLAGGVVGFTGVLRFQNGMESLPMIQTFYTRDEVQPILDAYNAERQAELGLSDEQALRQER